MHWNRRHNQSISDATAINDLNKISAEFLTVNNVFLVVFFSTETLRDSFGIWRQQHSLDSILKNVIKKKSALCTALRLRYNCPTLPQGTFSGMRYRRTLIFRISTALLSFISQTFTTFFFQLKGSEKKYFASVTESDNGLYNCTRTFLYHGQIYNKTFTTKLDVQPNCRAPSVFIPPPPHFTGMVLNLFFFIYNSSVKR